MAGSPSSTQTTERAAATLRQLSRQVRRLGLNGRFDPEQAFIERDDLAQQLLRLARHLEQPCPADRPAVAAPFTSDLAVPLRRARALVDHYRSRIDTLQRALAAGRPRQRRRPRCPAQLELTLEPADATCPKR